MNIVWNYHKTPDGNLTGIVVAALSPFKGICYHCGKRTTVRHYPYNAESELGVYCKPCFTEIDAAISEGGMDFHEDEGYW